MHFGFLRTQEFTIALNWFKINQEEEKTAKHYLNPFPLLLLFPIVIIHIVIPIVIIHYYSLISKTKNTTTIAIIVVNDTPVIW